MGHAQHGRGQHMGTGMPDTRQLVHLLPLLDALSLNLFFSPFHWREVYPKRVGGKSKLDLAPLIVADFGNSMS